MVERSVHGLQRRIAGHHDIRMDGMTDLLVRASGRSVFDIGCNRGHVALDFARYGASACYGCDNWEEGIQTARQNFADLRYLKNHQFEVVDLSQGPTSLAVFRDVRFDITLMLATYHKLKRVMRSGDLSELNRYIARRTAKFYAWRGTSDKPTENEEEIVAIDADLAAEGFGRVHTSYLSEELGVAAIWMHR